MNYYGSSAPAWFDELVASPPNSVPHWRIKFRVADEEHDGYCSGASGDLEIRKWTVKTLYLDDKFRSSDIVKGMKFDLGVGSGTGSCAEGGSGYCGARKIVEILAVKRVY